MLAASSFVAAPSLAQDGPSMWCYAAASNGADTSRDYSAFFCAGSSQAEAEAKTFKSEVDAAEI